jgi:putative ABC transport system permease protein
VTWYAFSGALAQGLVYGLMALGVFLTFRVLDFPDLTVDGSFPMGAAVSAVLIAKGVNPFVTLPVAITAGMMAGFVTAFLSTKLRILNLLASILTMIALYSINIRIMGKPNIALIDKTTIFDYFHGFKASLTSIGIPGYVMFPILFFVVIAIVKVIIDLFLHTELGMALRATGDNEKMIRAQGVNTHATIMLGVAISNGIVALCGALVAQYQGSADVNMGVGQILAGLASVIVGEALIGELTVFRATLGVILGSIIYKLAIFLALNFDIGNFIYNIAISLSFDVQPETFQKFSITASDLKLITAVLVVFALTFPAVRGKVKIGVFKKGGGGK